MAFPTQPLDKSQVRHRPQSSRPQQHTLQSRRPHIKIHANITNFCSFVSIHEIILTNFCKLLTNSQQSLPHLEAVDEKIGFTVDNLVRDWPAW